jgi:hypothetical protein
MRTNFFEAEDELVATFFREIFLREEVFGFVKLLVCCVLVFLGDTITESVL